MIRILRQNSIVIGALTGIFIGSAEAQQPTQSQLLVPDDLQLSIMIKTALIAFNNANLTGNYSVLRDLAAPSFREANSQARLAEIFKKQRDDKINISPIVLYQPVLSRKPWINNRQLLRLQGSFDTRPEQVKFNLAYSAVGNQWRLFAIGVTTMRPQSVQTNGEDKSRASKQRTGGSELKLPSQDTSGTGPVKLVPKEKPASQ